MAARIPLVIDTDPGIDDALAILLALASPEVDLRLVTTVHGNVDLALTTENALRVLHLAGRSDVPVAAGAQASLIHPQPERAGHVHGAEGLGGVQLPPSPARLDPRPAVVALADLLMSSPVPVTVAPIGPLTNIALLLAVYPEAAARIGRLVVMGGSAGRGGNVTAAAEFNIWSDPEAAAAVFGSTVPTVMVGLDVTLPTVLSEEGIARFASAGPIGATAAAILRQYLDHARDAYGTAGVVVHDALALTEAIAPGTLGTVRRDVVVDTTLGAGRGQTLVDRRTVSTSPSAVEVAETVDVGAAVEFLVSRLGRLDGPA
ncbi:pyrimidine-specific ribonucleoside hydrolase [Blastococcus aggregatus]|uniref:Pyrimidine-specific ribonucleoside hydrolase n=1 Tax=Blastococcus aggregatus TaxID=38502 RepID=A0A285VGX6_9ACTN|nr:nucleoside hydrolase [Blastococcus aggregatus]SOC53310.1 pyrimidine-specific ribonucleoside hydrolase [Blastococcus aggregatus]